MDLHTGAPYWLLKEGLRTLVPPLKGDASCEVCIVGGGITGALIAHELVNHGVSVIALDQRELALGSTLASTALLQYDLDMPLHELMVRKGRDPAERAFTVGVHAIERLQAIGAAVGSRVMRVPSLYVALSDEKVEHLRAEFEARRDAGLDVKWLGARECRDAWGVDCEAAIESSQAAQADPYELTHQVWRHAMSSGARVYDRTTVERLTEGAAGGFVLCTDNDATVRCDFVVYATGYAAAKFMPEDAVNLQSTFVFASEPCDKCPANFMLWEDANPYLYARWADRRLIVGGGDVPFVDEASRDRLLGAKTKYLLHRIRRVLPGVEIAPAFSWCGTFATTPDGLGYIGAVPGDPRQYVAFGFGGNGITMSAIAAEMIRCEILGTPHADADLFRPERAVRASRAPVGSGTVT